MRKYVNTMHTVHTEKEHLSSKIAKSILFLHSENTIKSMRKNIKKHPQNRRAPKTNKGRERVTTTQTLAGKNLSDKKKISLGKKSEITNLEKLRLTEFKSILSPMTQRND